MSVIGDTASEFEIGGLIDVSHTTRPQVPRDLVVSELPADHFERSKSCSARIGTGKRPGKVSSSTDESYGPPTFVLEFLQSGAYPSYSSSDVNADNREFGITTMSLNKRTIVSWCLYDFANSFYVVLPAVVWQIYYQNVIVGNAQGQGDLWWGRIISASMLTVALTSPMMGAIADFAGRRKELLIAYTLICVSAVALFGTVQPGMLFWGFVLTVVSYATFEGALVFYNAYLPEIAPREYQGRVSGWGFGTGYAGTALGLLLALLFVQQERYAVAWIAISVAFIVFSLPAFLWLPQDAAARKGVFEAAGGGVRESWRTFLEILRHKELRRFLLAYFFFEDGVNTVIYFAAGFATKTLGFSTEESIYLFLIVQISALAGAFLWAKPTDTLGPKRVLLIVLVQWAAVVTGAYLVQTKMQFVGVAVLAGLGLGAVQAGSRTFMALLIPKGREGDFFGFFALCGKSAAVMGPLVFGTVSHATGGNQRLAILAVLVLFVTGGVLLSRVRAGGPSLVTFPGKHADPSI